MVVAFSDVDVGEGCSGLAVSALLEGFERYGLTRANNLTNVTALAEFSVEGKVEALRIKDLAD
jgi:hypothetical protein